MKRNPYNLILVLIFLFILIKTDAQSNIIGNPIKIRNIEVAQYDFPYRMKWIDAMLSCSNLGAGWRLPTKDELNLIYINKSLVGNLQDPYLAYWSATEFDNSTAWYVVMKDGFTRSTEKFYESGVRAVRSVSNNSTNSVASNGTYNNGNTSNSNISSVTGSSTTNTAKICSWRPTKPVLTYVLMDNRKFCYCCNRRYARYSLNSNENIVSIKNQEEIKYLEALLDKHLETVNADEDHKSADRTKLEEFKLKTYGASILTYAQSLMSLYANAFSKIFGEDNILTNKRREIDRYNLVSKYCSRLCEQTCY